MSASDPPLCPLDGQRLASVRRCIGEPTEFTHLDGLQHGDTLSDLPLDDLRHLATEMTLDEFQRAINDMLATGMRTDFDAAWADEDERNKP